jgi:FixJ family two-component response regulator
VINDTALVYVVDDDASVRTAIGRLLRSVGLEIQLFASATEFLAFTRPERPGCIVLDVRMPRLSGLDLQQDLATIGAALPIIFVTGHADVPMSVRAMKAGAVDFLPKPFHDQDLLDAVQRAIAADRERRRHESGLATIRAVYETLTPREREVLSYVVSGALNKQIAGTLGTSEKTIKVHRARIMDKMGVESLADLVRLAGRLGVQGPGPD